MARKAKKPKFNEANVTEIIFGGWQQHDAKIEDFLKKASKLVVELGCARADPLIHMARDDPKTHFVGVDRKSERMLPPAKAALAEGLVNVAFVQTDIRDIAEYFPVNSIDEIWITFPDPYPRDKQEKHRMINNQFLDIYKRLLKPDGTIHFKTDDRDLWSYTVDEVLPSRKDINVEQSAENMDRAETPQLASLQTIYEKRWREMGRTISYLRCRFKA